MKAELYSVSKVKFYLGIERNLKRKSLILRLYYFFDTICSPAEQSATLLVCFWYEQTIASPTGQAISVQLWTMF